MPALDVYSDPVSRARLSLLEAFGRIPATERKVPEEDQLSSVLAWLCDQCPRFADRLVRAFLAGDAVAEAALDRSERLGARTQVWLPSLTGGPLRADLSIEADGRKLQLLVECKIDAGFNTYSFEGGALSQPEAYARAWRHCAPAREAVVRRVGTLTRDAVVPRWRSNWRARDLTWQQLDEMLETALEDGTIDTELLAIARDLHRHLGGFVLEPTVPAGFAEMGRFLEWGRRLVEAVCDKVAAEWSHAYVRGPARIRPERHNASRTLHAKIGPRELSFWIAVSPAGGSYAVPGWPASLQVALEYGDDATRAALLRAGFDRRRDRAGYTLPRAILPVADLLATENNEISTASAWILARLREAALDAM